jgi:hypothetical protein
LHKKIGELSGETYLRPYSIVLLLYQLLKWVDGWMFSILSPNMTSTQRLLSVGIASWNSTNRKKTKKIPQTFGIMFSSWKAFFK